MFKSFFFFVRVYMKCDYTCSNHNLLMSQKKNGHQRRDYKGGLLNLILKFQNLITYLDDPEKGLVDKLPRWKLSRSSTAESYWVSNGWCIGGG